MSVEMKVEIYVVKSVEIPVVISVVIIVAIAVETGLLGAPQTLLQSFVLFRLVFEVI